MKYKIFFEQGDRHDATIHYVNIIKKALERESGEDVLIVDNIKQIEKTEIVVVVNAKAHIKLLLKNRKQKVICWYQGIMPEEILVNYTKKDKWLKYILWRCFEYISLKLVSFALFGSDRMKYHYENKYKIKFKDNFYVMPCFNQKLIEESFFVKGKYETPSFVYAGTMSKWQCIDEMLQIYKEIKTKIPNATLILYTSEKKEAQDYLKKYNLENVLIDHLPYNQLFEALQHYKYGFIIRKDIEMNRVATPTKMNTYLANGVIPIYSNYIFAFKEGLKNTQYQIQISNNDEVLEEIISFEKKNIEAINVLENYKSTVFSHFYSEDFHINNLIEKIKKINL